MRKKQLFGKRILALALSASMIFALPDTHVVFAAETENQVSGYHISYSEEADLTNDSTEISGSSNAPDESGKAASSSVSDENEALDSLNENEESNLSIPSDESEASDLSNSSDENGESDLSNPLDESEASDSSNASDESDTSDSANTPDESDTPDSSNATVENGIPDSSGASDETETLDSSNQPDESDVPNLLNTPAETETPDSPDASDENDGEDYIAKYDGKGVEIKWILYKSGKLVIEGTTYGASIPDGWREYSDKITSAEINVSAEGDYYVDRLFLNCKNLESVDLSGLDTSRIIDMSYMFSGCSALESIDLSGFDTSKVTDMSYMFQNCSSLKSLDLGSFDTSKVKKMAGMFSGCTSLEELTISSFNTSKVEEMNSMFLNCNQLTGLDLSSFDTGSVTTMRAMFEGCSGFAGLDISGFDTGEVRFFDEMFKDCSGLAGLDVSGFDTSSGQFFGEMFADCSSLVRLDVSGFKTGGSLISGNMSGMFSNCSSLVSLDLSSFNIASGAIPILNGCTGLACIYTPISSRDLERLPTTILEHQWYKADGTQLVSDDLICSYDSSVIYRNDYEGDITEPKENLFLSGVSINKNKIYDNMPNEYIGVPTVTDSDGNTVSDITISEGIYTGILADGSVYEGGTQAPTQAGSYKVVFELTGEDTDKYHLKKNSFAFNIRRQTVTITAPTLSVVKNEKRPEPTELTCAVNGLVGGDTLITEPKLKYGEENISRFGEETYRIIPYGAEAGSNYNIRYVNGKLAIETMVYPIDNPDDEIILHSGVFNRSISWTLAKSGKLTVEGSSQSTQEDVVWGWHAYKKDIKSAAVKVSGLVSTKGMFEGCSNMESVDLSGLDTSKVTNMRGMFDGCDVLKTLDLSGFNTGKVTNMSNMFAGCWELVYLDISSFDTHNVTDMSNMFGNCQNLKRLNLGHFDTGNVTKMDNMFVYCMALTSLDVSSFDTAKVAGMSSMFAGCYSLRSINLGRFDTGKVTDMRMMFKGLKNLTSLDLNSFDTGNVTDMNYMFDGCKSLTSLDVSAFDTRNVADMHNMFSECTALENLNLSGWDTGKVTDFSYMFCGCSALKSLDLSYFKTGNATTMRNMFDGCSFLADIDISSFDTSNVKNMYHMFAFCSALTSIDASSLDISKTSNVTGIFMGCKSLTSLDLSSFDLEHIDSGYCQSMMDGCTSLLYLATPQNVHITYKLPAANGDIWYYAGTATQTTSMPSGAILCKNSTSMPDIEMLKTSIFISGIDIEQNKVYDAMPCSYSGTPAAVDSEGNRVEGITVSDGIYTGTLADGSVYSEGTQAPSQAGNYQLTFTVTGEDADKYSLKKHSYSFTIRPGTVTVTAPSLAIGTDEAVPALSGISYTSEGLLEGDGFTAEPQFKYSAEKIDTSMAGRYKIIPYGADAGNNYRIKYVNGMLTVGNPDYVPPESPEDDSPYDDSQRTDLGMADLKASISVVKAKTYDGNPYEPTVKVTVTENKKRKTLTEGTDYRVLYEDNINAGTGKVVIRGNGIYKGELTKSFTIKPKSIKKLKVIAGNVTENITEDDIANGTAELPVYVYDGGRLLTKGKDYNLTFKASKAKTVTLNIVSAQGSNYTGATTAKITIYEGIDPSRIINPANVTLEYKEALYTGKAVKPGVTVKIGDETLTNKNYKVQYQNNKNAGTAYVIVTGKGIYKGKVVVPFVITPDKTSVLQITNTIKAKTYNGKLQKPSVTVKAGKTKLKKNRDYTVSYTQNLHAGTATVTVAGRGNYVGTATQTFTINPQKISKISVKGTWRGGLILTYGTRKLNPNTDYTVKCESTAKNKAKIKITAIEGSDFTGSVNKTVKLR